MLQLPVIIFFTGCVRGKCEYRGEKAPAVKVLVFHFLCLLIVGKMPLANNVPWGLVLGLVCHLNT